MGRQYNVVVTAYSHNMQVRRPQAIVNTSCERVKLLDQVPTRSTTHNFKVLQGGGKVSVQLK